MADEEIQPAGALNTLQPDNPYGLTGGYSKMYADMQKQHAAQNAARQQYLASIQKRETDLQSQGMSDYDKAGALFQLSGALLSPTRSGGIGGTLESFGAGAGALAGPLSKAAEAKRMREQQIQQLQDARAKMGIEMAGGMDPQGALPLMKAQQDLAAGKGAETFKLETVEDKPVLVGSRGTIKPFSRAAAGMGEAPAAAPEDEIPPTVRALGAEAMKKYKERMGTKIADDAVAAQQSFESAQQISPILKRAEEAYNRLHKADAIGPIQGDPKGWSRWLAARVGRTNAEEDRQDYEQALADLELWRSTKLKGQGGVTDFERKIIASSLPKLEAINAVPGLNTFKTLNNELKLAMSKPSRVGGQQKQNGVVDFGDLK